MKDKEIKEIASEDIASPSQVHEQFQKLGIDVDTSALSKMELPVQRIANLVEVFNPYIEAAKEWIEIAKNIEVVDERDVESMKAARDVRLRLRDVRIKMEKKRKEMKKTALRTGQAIDGLFGIGRQLIEPVESDLQEKEDYVKNAEEHRLNELQEERENQISPFVANPAHYAVRDMENDEFEELRSSLEIAHEEKLKAKEKAAEEKKKNEEALRNAAALRKELLRTRAKALAPYQFADAEFLEDDELADLTEKEFDEYLREVKQGKEEYDQARRQLRETLDRALPDGDELAPDAKITFRSKNPNPLVFGIEVEDPGLPPERGEFAGFTKLRGVEDEPDPDAVKERAQQIFEEMQKEKIFINTKYGRITVIEDSSVPPNEIWIGRPWSEIEEELHVPNSKSEDKGKGLTFG